MIPRIVIAGTHSGAGKTTVTTGLLRALYQKELFVQPFKVGPDYIDPAFHSFVAKRSCRNLDVFMLGESMTKQMFYKNAVCADISVVEGVMGLYDGLGIEKNNGSTAHLSKIINAPVVLVIDGRGMAASAAALVTGYANYDKEVDIAGVIINNMHGEKHYELLKTAIEKETGIPCLGYLNKTEKVCLESRHLGLVPAVEVKALDEKLNELAQMVSQTIDVDKLIEIAKSAKPFDYKFTEKKPSIQRKIRLAVAKDKAFHFYYEDGLDILKSLGAQLVFFSPVHDKKLPEKIDGLYIGGGFPEVFARELTQNKTMRESILNAVESGMPTYAECGGLMYLSKGIETLEGNRYDMCGVFSFSTKMTKRLQRFGYVNVEIQLGSFMGEEGQVIKGHEFHRSTVCENEDQNLGYKVSKARPGQEHIKWLCGHRYKNCLGAYAHIHFAGESHYAQSFLEACAAYKTENELKSTGRN